MNIYGRNAIAVISLAFVSSSFATPITLIHSGIGSGTIDGKAFNYAAFTITATGDTDNRELSSSGVAFSLQHDSSTIEIAGEGIITIIQDTRTFVNFGTYQPALVGYSNAYPDGGDLFAGPRNSAFDSWDMLSSVGPVTGEGYIALSFEYYPIETDAGLLMFEARDTFATFQAIVVPEPGTALLLLCGLLALTPTTQRRSTQ